MAFNSLEELKQHLAETGAETTILSGDEDEPKTEARKQYEKEQREARQRALYGFLLPQIEEAGLPKPKREHSFWDDRKWRFDLAWPKQMIALEIEGGIWLSTGEFGKGHAHPARFISDCEKYSHAAIAGWRLIRATTQQVESGQALEWLLMAFAATTPGTALWGKLIGNRIVDGIVEGLNAKPDLLAIEETDEEDITDPD